MAKPKKGRIFDPNDPTYSYSMLGLFARCGEAGRRRYIEGDIVPPSLAMLCGSGVGAAAEENGLQKIQSHEDLPINEIVEAGVEGFKDRFKEDGFNKATEELKGKSKKAVEGQGVDKVVSLTTVYAESASPLIQPVAVEKEYTLDLGGAKVIAFTDVEEVIDGQYWIRDFKTAAAKKADGTGKAPSEADVSPQLSIYAACYYQETGELANVGLDAFIATKKPYHQRIESKRDRQDVLTVGRLFANLHKVLKSGVFMNAAGTISCTPGWCGYYATCPYVKKGKR